MTKANMAAAGEPAPNSHVIGRRRPARPGERIRPPAPVSSIAAAGTAAGTAAATLAISSPSHEANRLRPAVESLRSRVGRDISSLSIPINI